jgi:PERQ amino acid-rich with GYF domain-containing protein
MLLSFPLDPDPSTVELISDTVYASSATLDGRRFAAEFVTRRKADAAAARAARARAPASAADVLRAQPKAAPGNEWGAFKVVNKKKKGGK